MIEFVEKLIATLREELQQYGEMLARLDDQQQHVMRRAADAALQSVPLIQSQSSVLSQARESRFSAMKALCGKLNLPESSTFREMVPQVPLNYRPLLEALIAENNELLQRIQQRARQNHILLTRTIESMQHVINSLAANRPASVYNDDGNLFTPPPTRPAMYEAVC